MRRILTFFFVIFMVFVTTGCTGKADGFTSPGQVEPVEILSVTPSSGTTVTWGDTVSVRYRTHSDHGITDALVYKRDDGINWAPTRCGKGKGYDGGANMPINEGNFFWVKGHEVTVVVLSRMFTSQAEYDQAPDCMFVGQASLGDQVFFEKGTRIDNIAKYTVR